MITLDDNVIRPGGSKIPRLPPACIAGPQILQIHATNANSSGRMGRDPCLPPDVFQAALRELSSVF